MALASDQRSAISDNKLLRLLDAHLIQRLYDLLVDEV